jgi:mono/diheme cytochrome c family protein
MRPHVRSLRSAGRAALRLVCTWACAWVYTWACVWCVAGCDVDFNRMYEQPRYDEYEPSPYFANGAVMRHPPAGTVPRSRPMVSPDIGTGVRDGVPVERVPIDVTGALLARGQNRYDIFCAPCHGVTGTSQTQVAENMRLRPPPPLVLPPVRDYPAGRIYRAVAQGYGLMRAYAAELPLADRWAVVAYVQALQLSQQVALDALPPALQMEAASWLR